MRSLLVVCSIVLVASSMNPESSHAAAPQAYRASQPGVYTSFNGGSGGGGSTDQSRSPGQMLEQASNLGHKGEISDAVDIANRAYERGQHDPAFVINYIEVLTELANIDGEASKSVLNFAIKASNSLNKSKICNGKSDAELSYHFMVAMGALADSVMELNERIAAQIYAAQGRIAQNLRNNPGYPSASIEILGQPLMNLAKANAIKRKPDASFAAMNAAFEIGYTQFDAVIESRVFAELDQARLEDLVSVHQSAYRRKIEQWSRTAVASFESFKVDFDVANINGGRITSDDAVGKVTVVDLWATWCAPCREGIPHFIELEENFGGDEVEVIGISMDDTEDPASVVDTVKSFGIDNDVNYTLGVGTEAIKKQIPGKVLLPTTLFIDQTGTVRYVAQGYHDYDQLAAITKLLSSEFTSAKSFDTASR
jgi:thiol-disulfide isomerase/thioredoxin